MRNLARLDASWRRSLLTLGWAALVLLACCGCPLPQDATPDDGTRSGSDVAALNPGNSIETATPLNIGGGKYSYRSAIRTGSDVDVVELGTLDPGDRILVDLRATSGDLDPVIAVFDVNAQLLAFNDDRAADGSDLNPYVDFVLRGDRGAYFLAVSNYPGSESLGQYQADITLERSVGVPAPQGQVVFLEWRGGTNIVVRNVGTFDLPTFSAIEVGLPASQTQALKDRVQQLVRERYAGFNLTVLSSDRDDPGAQAYSTVYFGSRDPRAFAISEQIDSYNQYPTDDAIVFTGGFRDAFLDRPSFEEMANALANTVVHEVGHLLGLIHTSDCSDIMDTSCSNDRILSPQQFKTGRIDRSVFPFGVQPARDLLEWILGLVGV